MSSEGIPLLGSQIDKQIEVTEYGSFEEQFAHREQIEVAGGSAEVVDVKPEVFKEEVPIFFAPSWACDLEVYEPTLKQIFEQHRRGISLSHPRFGGDNQEALESLGLTLTEDLPYSSEELRKALGILEILKVKGIEKTDVITHSEGSLNIIIAALLSPEKFRNIILFAPAGLVGDETITGLLKGFANQNKRADSMKNIPVTDEEKLVGNRAIKSVLKYVAKNPLRSANEVHEISKIQIHEALRQLHEQGIGIVIMATVDDPVFPMEKIQEIVKDDMIDGFLSLIGGHGEIGNHPEMFIPQAEKMFEALEKKKLILNRADTEV